MWISPVMLSADDHSICLRSAVNIYTLLGTCSLLHSASGGKLPCVYFRLGSRLTMELQGSPISVL
jgi:hypothetical protein